MADNNVDITATIRLRAEQLRADAEKAKQEFKDVKKEAEKPATLAVETATATAKVDKVEQEVKEAKADIAKPVPIVVETSKADQVLADLQGRMARMRGELAGTAERLAARQSELQQEIAAAGGPGAAGRPNFIGSGGAVNEFRTGMEGVLKTMIAIDATITAIDVAMSGVDLTTKLINGSWDDVAVSAKGMEESIRGIPLVGNRIADLGAKINEAFTGAAAAAKAITEQAELSSIAIDAQRAAINLTNDALKDQQGIIDGLIRRREALGLTGSDRAMAAADEQATQQRVSIEEKAAADVLAIQKKNQDAINALKEKSRKAQADADKLQAEKDDQGIKGVASPLRAGIRGLSIDDELAAAKLARDSANAAIVAAEKIRDDEIKQIDAKKNEAIVEAAKTANAEQVQIGKDALDKQQKDYEDAIAKRNAAAKKGWDDAIKDMQKAAKENAALLERNRKEDERAAKAAADAEEDREREHQRTMTREREAQEQDEARIARERDSRIQRDTKFTNTSAMMDELQLATIAQAASSGVDVIGNVRRANGGSGVTGHDRFGGERGNQTEQEQLTVLQQIAENTKPKAANAAQVITD